MDWINCISAQRTGKATQPTSIRSDYQRDYDRLIFSSAFRRLQNKTQVFPLPGSSIFVHNRLTHSLEVASVGRSLGSIIGQHIAEQQVADHSEASFFTEAQWSDLTNFEGNANALRLLTHQFRGKAKGGTGLTYTTLASILKYPCESMAVSKAQKHTKKYGYFQSEHDIFNEIVQGTNMLHQSDSPTVYRRHPFVYLVEAADDICYRIIDMEDAHRIKLLSRAEIEEAFVSLLTELDDDPSKTSKITDTLTQLTDDNEAVTYLRAKTINALVLECARLYAKHMPAIISGTYTSTLLDDVEQRCPTLQRIEAISIDRIYNHHSVIKVELAGYNA